MYVNLFNRYMLRRKFSYLLKNKKSGFAKKPKLSRIHSKFNFYKINRLLKIRKSLLKKSKNFKKICVLLTKKNLKTRKQYKNLILNLIKQIMWIKTTSHSLANLNSIIIATQKINKQLYYKSDILDNTLFKCILDVILDIGKKQCISLYKKITFSHKLLTKKKPHIFYSNYVNLKKCLHNLSRYRKKFKYRKKFSKYENNLLSKLKKFITINKQTNILKYFILIYQSIVKIKKTHKTPKIIKQTVIKKNIITKKKKIYFHKAPVYFNNQHIKKQNFIQKYKNNLLIPIQPRKFRFLIKKKFNTKIKIPFTKFFVMQKYNQKKFNILRVKYLFQPEILKKILLKKKYHTKILKNLRTYLKNIINNKKFCSIISKFKQKSFNPASKLFFNIFYNLTLFDNHITKTPINKNKQKYLNKKPFIIFPKDPLLRKKLKKQKYLPKSLSKKKFKKIFTITLILQLKHQKFFFLKKNFYKDKISIPLKKKFRHYKIILPLKKPNSKIVIKKIYKNPLHQNKSMLTKIKKTRTYKHNKNFKQKNLPKLEKNTTTFHTSSNNRNKKPFSNHNKKPFAKPRNKKLFRFRFRRKIWKKSVYILPNKKYTRVKYYQRYNKLFRKLITFIPLSRKNSLALKKKQLAIKKILKIKFYSFIKEKLKFL